MDNKLFVTLEDGSEKEMEILFTFFNEEYGKNYVVFFDPLDDASEAYAMSYDEEGNMFAVEDDEEYSMIMEVYSSFEEDDQE